MASKLLNRNFFIRLATGVCYVAITLTALLIGSAWLLFALYTFFVMAGIIEFNKLTQVNRTRSFRITADALAGVWLLYAAWQYGSARHSAAVFVPYAVYLLYLFVRPIFSHPKALTRDTGNSLLGQLIVALPLALGILLSFPSRGLFNGHYLLLLYVMMWANDTGAYLVGSLIGKHKMCPRISPGKTWEGLAGGMLLTIAAAYGVIYCLPIPIGLSSIEVALAAVVLSAAGTLGDLFESVLKRAAGAKDSGRVLPGHGGVLDRLDSLLLAIPTYFLLLYLLSLR